MERDWLYQAPDCSGECDRCHKEDKPLWEDTEHWGSFAYCQECWLKILKAREQKETTK